MANFDKTKFLLCLLDKMTHKIFWLKTMQNIALGLQVLNKKIFKVFPNNSMQNTGLSFNPRSQFWHTKILETFIWHAAKLVYGSILTRGYYKQCVNHHIKWQTSISLINYVMKNTMPIDWNYSDNRWHPASLS